MITKDNEHQLAKAIQDNFGCDVILNKKIPFTLYKKADIMKILKKKNAHQFKSNILIKRNTKGGEQMVAFITLEDVIKLVIKTETPVSMELRQILNINVDNYVYIETDVFRAITTTFRDEQILVNYKVGDYILEMYFIEYNLVIDIDDEIHNDQKRIRAIQDELNCDFISFNAQNEKFNIFQLLNEIWFYFTIHYKDNYFKEIIDVQKEICIDPIDPKFEKWLCKYTSDKWNKLSPNEKLLTCNNIISLLDKEAKELRKSFKYPGTVGSYRIYILYLGGGFIKITSNENDISCVHLLRVFPISHEKIEVSLREYLQYLNLGYKKYNTIFRPNDNITLSKFMELIDKYLINGDHKIQLEYANLKIYKLLCNN